MGTRACYTFIDDDTAIAVYSHWDGYPAGAAIKIEKASPFAWELPCFEANDFAAAFVAGNKTFKGGAEDLLYSGSFADFQTWAKRAGRRLTNKLNLIRVRNMPNQRIEFSVVEWQGRMGMSKAQAAATLGVSLSTYGRLMDMNKVPKRDVLAMICLEKYQSNLKAKPPTEGETNV